MAFQLNCANSEKIENATETDIDRAFADDLLRGEFVILIAADGSFVQAAFDGSEPCCLEYWSHGNGQQLEVDVELSKDQVLDAFKLFLRGDSTWRTKYRWRPIKKPSGCLFSLLFVSIIAATFVF